MDPLADARLRTHFAALPDPRVDRAKRHELLDILTIALCAVLCGADTWVDIQAFGNAKLNWFRTFLRLPPLVPVVVHPLKGVGRSGSHQPGRAVRHAVRCAFALHAGRCEACVLVVTSVCR